MKSSHSCECRSNTLPTTTPSDSSRRATATPSSTEMMLARRMTPARTAASWTGSTDYLHVASLTFGRGHQRRSAVWASLIAMQAAYGIATGRIGTLSKPFGVTGCHFPL